MSKFNENKDRRIIYIPEITDYIRAINYLVNNNLLDELISMATSDVSFSKFLIKDAIRKHVKLGHNNEKFMMRQNNLNDKHKNINLNNISWSIYEKNKRWKGN